MFAKDSCYNLCYYVLKASILARFHVFSRSKSCLKTKNTYSYYAKMSSKKIIEAIVKM